VRLSELAFAMVLGALIPVVSLPAFNLAGQSQEPVRPLPFSLDIGAQLQLRYTHEEPEGTGEFRVRRARVALSGIAYERFSYAVQIDLRGSGNRLLDANVRYSPDPRLTLWAGQGKVSFGRQHLTSSRNLQFVDRSIADDRFAVDRQVGMSLTARSANRQVELTGGVYNGEGIASPTNANGRFMTVGRVTLAPLGSIPLTESSHDYPDNPRVTLGLAALRNTLGDGPESTALTRFNGDAAFRLKGWNAFAEIFHERSTPSGLDSTTSRGWHLQAGYLFPGSGHELAGRVAVVDPGAEAEAGRTETGVAYSRYLQGHGAKLQADFRNIRPDGAGDSSQELRVQLQVAF
jgi:phosphate-selective porin OprO and OprP